MLKKKKNKVIVAMSGGVDSSVAAALLQKAGYEVSGVFMRFWTAPSSENSCGWNRCCSPESQERARKVARLLGIPFYVLNCKKDFKKKVVDYFLKEYEQGRTPNPCVVCNKEIKFGLFLKKAMALKTDFIATGHYVRNVKCQMSDVKTISQKLKVSCNLLRGRDRIKDQSYFLWQLGQKQLCSTLFPLGEYTKKRVKAMAKKYKLPVVGIAESQEICFIKNSLEEFLSQYIKPKIGDIVTKDNKVIGKHKGLHLYTIGQRKGIEVSGGPFYVIEKDLKKNVLIVSPYEKDIKKKELFAEKINWISGKEPKLPLKIKAKIRYGHPAVSAIIYPIIHNTKYKILFGRAQRAVTPGQSIVFYGQKNEVLGGGVIVDNSS